MTFRAGGQKPVVMVDAGVIVRGLIAPSAAGNSREQMESRRSAELLRQVARGETQIALTDASIAALAAVLTSPRHFQLSRQEAESRLRALLSDVGVRVVGRAAILAALDRWLANPAIGFSQALTIERASEAGAMLADDVLPALTESRTDAPRVD